MTTFNCSFLNVLTDQILPFHLLKFCLEAYRQNYENEDDPFISPIIVKDSILRHLPPVRMIVGSSDPLRDDSILFLKRLM
jgi:hormone-sensitive lipase